MSKICIILRAGSILLFLCALSCNENTVEPDRVIFYSREIAKPTDPPTDPLQDYLSDLWYASNHDEWDVISGVIDPEAGGIVSGNPVTWPAGYSFSVEIPPDAVSECDSILPRGRPADEFITIEIHIPRFDPEWPPGEGHPAVFKLEPDGLQFDSSVSVTFCFPPWLEANESYQKFCFFMISQEPEVFGYSDLETVYPGGQDLRKAIKFETMHFSRWGLDEGKGGGGPIGPGGGDSGGGGNGGKPYTYIAEPNIR